MKRLWIIFKTEYKAWLRDPISTLGGIIPTTIMLIAFGALFGGKLSFSIAVVDQDQSEQSEKLIHILETALSPLNNQPYYDIQVLDEEEAKNLFVNYQIEGYWVIPEGFGSKVIKAESPEFEMVFNNYNDDRAKNHRIYAAEILWQFYEESGYPAPPMQIQEKYPRDEMIQWFPIIAVGILALSIMLGSMVNIFMLTHKEHTSGITMEFRVMPRSLLWVFGPKILFSLIVGWGTGLLMSGLIYLSTGIFPGIWLVPAFLVSGLVNLFWIGIAMLFGFSIRQYFSGMIANMLIAITIFFTSGGLNITEKSFENIKWYQMIFPFIYSIGPIRDMVLFHNMPSELWTTTIPILSIFAIIGLVGGCWIAAKHLRYLS